MLAGRRGAGVLHDQVAACVVLVVFSRTMCWAGAEDFCRGVSGE